MAKALFCLPAEFARKSPPVIEAKPKTVKGFRRLPFVGSGRWHPAICWSVPAVGGYYGGCQVGEVMAVAYLKWLRGDNSGVGHAWLLDIQEAFMYRWAEEGGVEMESRGGADRSAAFESLRGQSIGFFSTLSKWMTLAAKQHGASLDAMSEESILTDVNSRLSFDFEAHMASQSRPTNSGRAEGSRV